MKHTSLEPIRKSFTLKEAGIQENRLRGAASVTGVMDRSWYNDVIFPKAFKKCLPDFLENGFVPVGHDWSGLPVAMPVSAKEEGNALMCEAIFHSTEAAQEARTVCMERLENGLSVGLSIGFMPDYDKGVFYFDSGAEMLKYAESNGYDLDMFDQKGIRACKTYCRAITGIKELYEFSIVAIPANPAAQLTDAKSYDLESATMRDFERFLREAGGLSRSMATRVALNGFKGLLRDAENGDETESIPLEKQRVDQVVDTETKTLANTEDRRRLEQRAYNLRDFALRL